MFRQNTYNEGNTYCLIPVARKAVVPGESVAIDSSISFESEPFSQNVMTGGIATAYAFYVPYRLLSSVWVQFLADPQDASVLPQTTTSWNFMFEGRTADTISSFGRRAYKLIYNQYFGQDAGDTDFWYADFTLDTDVSIKQLRTTDQLNGKVQIGTEVATQTATYPVSGGGTIATIDLNDLRQRLKDAKSYRRADMTGDKYVDALRRMGVDLDWRVQQAPEFLGQSSVDFGMKDTRATDPTNTGRAWSRFQESFRLRTKRKFFAEHGIVMVVLAVRPHIFSNNPRAAADAAMLNLSRETIFLGDNDTGTYVPTNEALGATGGGSSYRCARFAAYRYGQNLMGATNPALTGVQPWSIRGPVAIDQVMYNSGSAISTPFQDQLFAGNIAVCGVTTMAGPSPVRPNIL